MAAERGRRAVSRGAPLLAPILWACAPSPDPVAESALTVEGCGGLDWVVHLSGLYDEAATHVVALPDGDVVVAGYHGGQGRIGTGLHDDLEPARGFRDGFVARLGPSGVTRWAHTVGGPGADAIEGLTLVDGAVWVAGDVVGGGLQVDGRPMRGEGELGDESGDAYGLRFTTTGGVPGPLLGVPFEGQQKGTGATEDAHGNTWLTGYFHTPDFTFGEWSVPGNTDAAGVTGEAFLAAWDSAGQPRWLTSVSGEYNDTGIGLVPTPGALLWALEVPTDQHEPTVSGAFGPTATLPLHGQRSTVLAVDPSTGAVDAPAFGLPVNWMKRIRAAPDGADVWGDALAGQPYSESSFGYRARVNTDGAVRDVSFASTPVLGGSVAGAGRQVIAGSLPTFDLDLGSLVLAGIGGDAYTSYAATLVSDVATCGWTFVGEGDAHAVDAVLDATGGIVVVGYYHDQLIIRDSEERTLATLGAETASSDGFIARFAPPSPGSGCGG